MINAPWGFVKPEIGAGVYTIAIYGGYWRRRAKMVGVILTDGTEAVRVDIRVYRTFLLVARLLNITKAADQLNFSQPAITAQMHSLEEEFQVRIFDRSGKRLTLTKAGRQLIGYAERTLALYEETKNAMAEFSRGTDTIRLGVSTQMINYLLPSLLMEFQRQMPNVFVSIEVCMNTQDVLKGMVEQRYDLGFIHGTNTLQQVQQHRVWTEEVHWVASADFLRAHPELERQDVREWPIINFSVGGVFRAKFDEWMKDTGMNIKAVLEYSDSEAIKRAVIGGLGVSYLPRVLVEEAAAQGKLAILGPKVPFHLDISLVHLRNKAFTLPMYALLMSIVSLAGADRSIEELLTGR
jgi:DNA-binding transcriptional LysR family regulator